MSLVRARALVAGIDHLPVLPGRAAELVALAGDPDAEPVRLVPMLEADPVLSAMVLRLVNSASTGLSRPTASLRNAAVLLGAGHLRSLALAASMATLFGEGDGQASWAHAVAVGAAARSLALSSAPALAEPGFTAGLLHDLGLVLLATHLKDADVAIGHRRLEGASVLEAEVDVLGCDHGALGAALAERWQAPRDLVAALAATHAPLEEADPLAEGLCRLLHAAEAAIADVVGAGGPEDPADGPTAGPALEAIAAFAPSGRDPQVLLTCAITDAQVHLSAVGFAPSPAAAGVA